MSMAQLQVSNGSLSIFDNEDPTEMESTRSFAAQSLAISVQEWKELGQGEDPSVAATNDLHETVERLVSLFLVRIVAIVASDDGIYKDFSTTTICRSALIESKPWFTDHITEQVVEQLRQYIRRILKRHRDLPFHNYERCYHVVCSANKLIDLMLSHHNSMGDNHRPPPLTFGLRNDPVALFGLMFAALIHDVEHMGVTNQQMVQEDDQLALQFNDTSIHEQRSLHLAFREFLKDDYSDLRAVLFATPEDYRHFRLLVINAVLSTDLGSPERAQISKSKWREAFGDCVVDDLQARDHVRRSSIVSDITTDSYAIMKKQREVEQHNVRQSQMRRLSNQSGDDSSCSDFCTDSLAIIDNDEPRNNFRLRTNSGDSTFLSYANDSMQLPKRAGRRQSTEGSIQTYVSERTFESVANDSIHLTQKRMTEQTIVRPRPWERQEAVHEEDSAEWNDDDDYQSLSPPSSDDGFDGGVLSGVTLSRSVEEIPLSPLKSPIRAARNAPLRGLGASRSFDNDLPIQCSRRRTARRASTGNVPVRFGPLKGQRIDEELTSDVKKNDVESFHESMRIPSVRNRDSLQFKKRLGIRRSMDLSGESIEVYSRHSRVSSIGNMSIFEDLEDNQGYDYDDYDAMKHAVVFEVMLRAADVAHSLQNWEVMTKWSSKLFKELLVAHKACRGHDPRPGWFDNQIKIMESYLLPLANQLDEMGIFGDTVGPEFAQIIEENHDRWLLDGFDLTESLKEEATAN